MKIVVVEDENNSREGLVRLIGKLDSGYEVVGEADNGEEGIAIIERTKPDLVISDIQMPGMSGLEMLDSLRVKGFRHKMIILTGFSEFEYAHKAIKMSVSDYLEKPITVSDLSDALNKVKLQLIEQSQATSYQMETSGSVESLFIRMFDLKDEEADLQEELIRDVVGFSRGSTLQLAVFSHDSSPNSQHSSLKIELAEMWQKVSIGTVFGIPSSGWTACVVQMPEEGMDGLEFLNNNILPEIIKMGTEIVCCYGEVVELTNLKTNIEELLKLMKWSLLLGNSKAIRKEDIKLIDNKKLPYPSILESNCSRAIVSGKGEEIQKQFKIWIDEFANKKYDPLLTIDYCTRFVSYMLRLANDLHGFILPEPLQSNWFEHLRGVRTMPELISIMNEVESNLIAIDTLTEIPVNSLLVQKAVRMIQDRYVDGVTLDEIAGSLHVSTAYLSGQFNKEVGQPFSSYIRDLRLRKAKELLLGNGLRTFEIALRVGYPDPKYFSRVFKEATGMSPGEYQKFNSR